MINRLMSYFEEPQERFEADFWTIGVECGYLYVTRETAEDVMRQLNRFWRPRWLRFTDIFGSTVVIRSQEVQGVYECTGEQRALEREFRRARFREEQPDRPPWEED